MTQAQTTRFSSLFDLYSSFVERVRADLPKIDTDLAIKLLMHHHKHPNVRQRLRLELVYEPGVNIHEKKEAIYASLERAAEVRERHILLIDAFMTMHDVEELARDSQLRIISGEFIY